VGKTTRITKDGGVNGVNSFCGYLVVEAESTDAAARLFEDHPRRGGRNAFFDVTVIVQASPHAMISPQLRGSPQWVDFVEKVVAFSAETSKRYPTRRIV
jgi:hypothetical protein